MFNEQSLLSIWKHYHHYYFTTTTTTTKTIISTTTTTTTTNKGEIRYRSWLSFLSHVRVQTKDVSLSVLSKFPCFDKHFLINRRSLSPHFRCPWSILSDLQYDDSGSTAGSVGAVGFPIVGSIPSIVWLCGKFHFSVKFFKLILWELAIQSHVRNVAIFTQALTHTLTHSTYFFFFQTRGGQIAQRIWHDTATRRVAGSNSTQTCVCGMFPSVLPLSRMSLVWTEPMVNKAHTHSHTKWSIRRFILFNCSIMASHITRYGHIWRVFHLWLRFIYHGLPYAQMWP